MGGSRKFLWIDLALEWIDSPQVNVATAGWATLSLLVGTREDSALDMTLLKKLLDRVTINIHKEKNRVRYTMNGFVIAVGGYVQPLYEKALMVARKIGVVHVDVGETACKVPDALAYISKMVANGSHGKKRKSVRC